MLRLTLLLWLTISAGESAAAAQVQMVDGRAQLAPSVLLADDGEWLALACKDSGCALWPERELRRVEVPDGSPQGEALNGLPTFEVDGAVIGSLITWLRVDPELPWLRPGALPSAFPVGPTAPRIGGAGDFEITLGDATRPAERLIPVLESIDYPRERIRLRLRSGAAWQWLGVISVCFESLDTSYLRWAGDLDGDGASDWLIDFGSYDEAPLRLFLSSRAKSGQLVGEAGRTGNVREADCCEC